MSVKQATDTILMVRPANFGFNTETAENNVFQDDNTELTVDEIKSRARQEFDNMASKLRSHGVEVIVIEDTSVPAKTDAIFPNNWISTHHDGSIYTFPMFSPNRRLERRADIIDTLSDHYKVDTDESLLAFESSDQYLEGTGSMILDRPNKIIYACYSVRTDKEVLSAYGEKLGYKVVGFDAVDEGGIPYYHTNVIMTLGEKIAVLCTESIADIDERSAVIQSIEDSGKEIVHITRDQVLQFAGNMLEVEGSGDKKLLVMSEAAYNALSKDQLHIIKNHNKIVYCTLETIEKFGGGSARCMMAEIFLPKGH